MPPNSSPDPSAVLDPSARRASPRVRLGVGAAVALFIAAVVVAAVMSFAASGGGEQGEVGFAGNGASGAGASGDAAATVATAAPPVVLVHVLGAVASPGIVQLDEGARVVDAIAAAGGLTAEADPAGVNLARAVADGEQLIVPKVGEVPAVGAAGDGAAAGGTGAGGAGDGKVHLNTADVAELDMLPRIGPALAQRIIDWREANGPFTSTDQLLDVAGIGDAVYSGLVDLVAL
ncbi:ComEA family DNA-binding protein [Agromyces sp. S2-1-8]|uniref:ComEA family DNA-binding protein n=1 Tax=Agromyces sp. S2-1-8 TaxID=2897180 RepID=UPI001E36FE1C|nr:ComEA family DNA-binding protein [Agromyces sp. S2-1-8]MCD5347326.1 ComEA family DNA-binding protein [Agromyces sp. S2-1-8]